MPPRHSQRKYDLRWGAKSIDYVGQRMGRLLCVSYVGVWRTNAHWRFRCDCGAEVIARWRPDIQSCGCLNAENIAKRDFRVQRPDGTWGLYKSKPVTLSDGRTYESVTALAKIVGISKRTMARRIKTMPESEWMKPGKPVGMGAKKHRMRLLHETRARWRKEREQPWSRTNIAKAIAANEKRKREKDGS